MKNVTAFLDHCKRNATEKPARILFAEGEDERIQEACAKIFEEKTAQPILIGEGNAVEIVAKKLRIPLISPHDPQRKKMYAQKLYERRKAKGLSQVQAEKLMNDRNYFATMMLAENEADGLINGATCPTADTVRPAIQIIGTKEKFHKVSGFFFMVMETKLLLFADCAVTIDPNSHDLADIAIDTAETAKRFNIEPRIAMLSFSTAGSGRHPSVDKVREAVALIRDERPNLLVEGEMQVDAALVPDICERKFPNARLKGNANIFIFPDLNSGNIAYKLVQRLAKAHAIGPILQGLKKPVNDLSRGCSVQDIVDLAAITTCEYST